MKKYYNIKISWSCEDCSNYIIDGLHLTSWRPCWRYNTKEYVINSIVGSSRRGWLSLSTTSREIDCKPRIVTAHANQYPFQLLSLLEQSVNKLSIKFCNYTYFDALFSSVTIDFAFLYLNQIFEIAIFVY